MASPFQRTLENAAYIGRDVDDQLRSRAGDWSLSNETFKWIRLVSSAGRGNSSLLKHFMKFAESESVGLGARCVLADCSAKPDAPPDAVPPFVGAVLAANEKLHSTPARRARIWILFVLLALVISVLLAFAVGVLVYIQQPCAAGQACQHDFGDFVRNFLPANWKWFPVWLLATLLLSLMLPLYPRARQFVEEKLRKKLRSTEVVRVPTADLYLEVPGILADLAQGHRTLVLLLDDYYATPESVRRFFEHLADPPPSKAKLLELREKARILVVSIDNADSNSDKNPILVPKFELEDVEQIAEAMDGNPPSRDVLERARENIKRLFEPRFTETDRHVREIFDKAYEKSENFHLGLAEAMVYWAVRAAPSVPLQELMLWMEAPEGSAFRKHLQEFDKRPHSHWQSLKDAFLDTPLAMVARRIVYFEEDRCTALRTSLTAEHFRLAADAHYFWMRELAKPLIDAAPDPARLPTVSLKDRGCIKRAAWHAEQIGVALPADTAIGADILQEAKLSDEEKESRAVEAMQILLLAARAWRDDGALRDADTFLLEAADWLNTYHGPQRLDWLDTLAEELWRSYRLSGDVDTYSRLQSLVQRFPELPERAVWLVHERYDDYLRGITTVRAIPGSIPGTRPDVVNLDRLTRCLLAIRSNEGFRWMALKDPDLAIEEPLPSLSAHDVEFQLHHLTTEAAMARGGSPSAQQLTSWRDRLGRFGQATSLVEETITEAWKAHYLFYTGVFAQKGSPEEVHALLFEPNDSVEPMEIWGAAREAGARAYFLAGLLDLKPVQLDVAFTMAKLIRYFTPENERVDRPDGGAWWKPWEEFCNAALELERSLGQVTLAPEVRIFLWDYFKEVELQATLQDLYELLLSVQKAQFPLKLILAWHRTAIAHLIAYGESQEDHRWVADLELTWADKYALLPEAKPFRSFPECLEFEQANSYIFASQSLRQSNDFERASELLDRCDKLIASVTAGDQAREEGRAQLLRSAMLQRAWLCSAQEDIVRYRELIIVIWRETKKNYSDAAVALDSLISVESQTGLLDQGWPPPGAESTLADGDNPTMSLPVGGPAVFKNRFEFRFRQYLGLVTESPNPSAEELSQLSQSGWKDLSFYAKRGLDLCRAGLRFELNEAAKALLLNFLNELAGYFYRVEKIHLKELEALKLLAMYEPESGAWDKYLAAAREYKALVARYVMAGKNWLERARHWAECLQILENKRKRQELEPGSDSDYWQGLERRTASLRNARLLAKAGKPDEALDQLIPMIPPVQPQWIWLEDLECLDFATSCAQQTGHIDLVETWAPLMRKLAHRYIVQSIQTITDPNAHQLAVELLRELDAHQ